jgi:peptidoglycan/xylan/chitin deacetylase (PgdA/CDA1 family)
MRVLFCTTPNLLIKKMVQSITSMMPKRKSIYSAVLLLTMSFFFQYSFAATATGDISLLLTYENGSKVSLEDMSLKLYKDSDKVPFREVQAKTNPVELLDLPLDHKYKIEVYYKDLYQDVRFYDLKEEKNDFVIPIKSPGGIRLGVFFDDNETPIKNAEVFVKTMGGNLVGMDKTDLTGNTVVFWIPQTHNSEYYDVDIVIDPFIKFTHKKLQVSSFEQQDIRIVTPWPPIIDSMISIEVYKDEKTKVSKSDGEFVIQVNDKKKKMITQSPVSSHGDSSITNIPVGTYSFHVTSPDGKIIASKKVSLSGNHEPIKIFLNNPQLNTDSLYCNCVAFRFDDVQDNYLNKAQLQMLKLTGEMDVGITVGVIGGVIGNDKLIVDAIQEQLAKNPKFEIASHSLNNQVISRLSIDDQNNYINKTDAKIRELFHVKPTVFIPPENIFDKQTISILKQYGYDHISSSIIDDPNARFEKSDFYHFNAGAYTAKLDSVKSKWNHISKDKIMEQINDSLFDYGYAVVMMHPYEFSNYENGIYLNEVNQTKFDEFKSLVSDLKKNNLLLTPIGKIENYKTEKFDKTVPIVIDERNKPSFKDCNCVAFKIDNVQDFWINDVQNEVIETFSKKDSPVTVSLIGKFFGTDPKLIDFLKQKIKDKQEISFAIRGWEVNDHSQFNLQEQSESIRLTHEQILSVLGIDSNSFSPPFGKFNDKTIIAMKENDISYIIGSISADAPSFKSKPFHVPETSSLISLIDDDPFFKGTLMDKISQKIQTQQANNGYALISLQPSDFALRDSSGTIINKIDSGRITQLVDLLDYLKSHNIQIVLISDLPLEASYQKYPEWIKEVFNWNAKQLITDKEFDNLIIHLIA